MLNLYLALVAAVNNVECVLGEATYQKQSRTQLHYLAYLLALKVALGCDLHLCPFYFHKEEALRCGKRHLQRRVRFHRLSVLAVFRSDGISFHYGINVSKLNVLDVGDVVHFVLAI